MKEFYVLKDGKKAGPYTLYELKERKIHPKTQIWSDENGDWFDAEQFSELKHIIIVPGWGDEYLSPSNEVEIYDTPVNEAQDKKKKVNFANPKITPLVPSKKKYYILQNGIQKGPYTKEELFKNGVTYKSQIWTDINEPSSLAGNLNELNDLFNVNKNLSTTRNPINDDFFVFGYKIADNKDREKGAKVIIVPSVIFVLITFYVIEFLYPENKNTYLFIFCIATFIFLMLYNLFISFPNFSASYEYSKVGLKLICSDTGEDLSELFKTNKTLAIKKSLKYMIPWYVFLRNGKTQTLMEKFAGFYLVKK
ncbi:MAG: DUF4339 domain-containing protein [Bacteroidetes bacterium]|nr:DUF4339 domain-containing protein [Bacteroidota bacterium]